MDFKVNFGTLAARSGAPVPASRFRLAVLGDFAGRANKGELATGEALARRKPYLADVDTLDGVMARLGITLRLPLDGARGVVELSPASMDDFHPDALAREVELFAELSGLRRRLTSGGGTAAAIQEVMSWTPEAAAGRAPPPAPRGAALPAGTLGDFARLMGQPTAQIQSREAATADALIRHIVAPHVVAARAPGHDAAVAAVDRALSGLMRTILHHPDFQTLEGLWRGVDLLTRRLETDQSLQIVLYDVTAEEIAADLAQSDALEKTGLYKLLVEQPQFDAAQGALSTIIGAYTFGAAPAHAELLGRLARIAAAARAPFVAALDTAVLAAPDEALAGPAWQALRGLPETAYLGLALPRFLLRMPYGKRTDPIDAFAFEEMAPEVAPAAMPWGNPALLVGMLLGETFRRQGRQMRPGAILTVDDMPYLVATDADGDKVALPSTERQLSEAEASRTGAAGLMPLLSIRGRPEVRLGTLQSLAGTALAGPWPG